MVNLVDIWLMASSERRLMPLGMRLRETFVGLIEGGVRHPFRTQAKRHVNSRAVYCGDILELISR